MIQNGHHRIRNVFRRRHSVCCMRCNFAARHFLGTALLHNPCKMPGPILSESDPRHTTYMIASPPRLCAFQRHNRRKHQQLPRNSQCAVSLVRNGNRKLCILMRQARLGIDPTHTSCKLKRLGSQQMRLLCTASSRAFLGKICTCQRCTSRKHRQRFRRSPAARSQLHSLCCMFCMLMLSLSPGKCQCCILSNPTRLDNAGIVQQRNFGSHSALPLSGRCLRHTCCSCSGHAAAGICPVHTASIWCCPPRC